MPKRSPTNRAFKVADQIQRDLAELIALEQKRSGQMSIAVDGPRNLADAIAVAARGKPGVCVVFAGKIIKGDCVSKTDSDSADAFESINRPLLGSVSGDTVRWHERLPVPVEKLVRNLKYLKEFKDASQKLDLVSIHPTKLHGATEAWVYDTAKRKLHHYVADQYSKCFAVKGNTLLGFDSKESEIKTLRKPAEQLKEVMGSKPAARKYFGNIKAVATSPKGRFNSDMVILKAF